MAEKKMKTTLERIEQLILDGNKEVVERIEKRLDERTQELRQEMQGVERKLGDKINKIDKQEAANAAAAYDLLTDVRKELGEVKSELKEEIREVGNKLDAHLKVPPACR